METYVFAFLIVYTAVTLSEACDNGWVPFGSSCYKYFTDRKTWSQAKTYCESQTSHLAIVMSTEENNFLKAELRKHHIDRSDQVWMDGDDLKVEGNFVWANTGEGFEITDWGPNEPNQNGGNEDCLTFFALYNFQWNDEHCDRAFGFLCEKDNTNRLLDRTVFYIWKVASVTGQLLFFQNNEGTNSLLDCVANMCDRNATL